MTGTDTTPPTSQPGRRLVGGGAGEDVQDEEVGDGGALSAEDGVAVVRGHDHERDGIGESADTGRLAQSTDRLIAGQVPDDEARAAIWRWLSSSHQQVRAVVEHTAGRPMLTVSHLQRPSAVHVPYLTHTHTHRIERPKSTLAASGGASW